MNARWGIAVVAFVTIPTAAFGQGSVGDGTFQNLSLQEGSLPVITMPAHMIYVPFVPAFPGWTGSIDGVQPSQVLLNSPPSPGISIELYGAVIPTAFPPIGNEFTVMLSSYYHSSTVVSLSQTGMVPAGAETLQIKIGEANPGLWLLSLAGQSVSMVPITVTPGYTLYQGNVSSFAGKIENLAITAQPSLVGGANLVTFCDITFQGISVPEPGTFLHLGLGALLLFRRGWTTPRRSNAISRRLIPASPL